MASSSSNRKRKYEVFLSFSGEDTRQSFLSHLRRRLDDEHIITFKDDRMERGKEIAPTLLEAIESSKIAVVILSKHYASSRWCLDELVKILECQEKNGLLVLPIFFHVDPSDVRKPTTGTFAVDFVRHEENFNKLEVTTWATAMTKVANLSGHPLGNG